MNSNPFKYMSWVFFVKGEKAIVMQIESDYPAVTLAHSENISRIVPLKTFICCVLECLPARV